MKILSVELENLNSLVGRWKIDFTDPTFTANGIFAIVGPTGAGKSTILDAICLALFGRTPRLKGISKTENEIMSRHTGNCFAEVVFETNRHGMFRCTWSQRRARDRVMGNLQTPEHQIAAADGTIIETKHSLVPSVVEQKTGMTFERFTRSMLLAQGDFAKFLQSDDAERGEILEQLTGTEIYGKISVAVLDRHRAESLKLERLDEQLRGEIPMDAEALATLHAEINGLTEQETAAETALKNVAEVVRRYETIDRLTEAKKNLDESRTKLEQSETTFRPEAEQLSRAQRATTLEPAFKELDVLRKTLEQVVTEIAKTDVEIPSAEKKVAERINLEETASVALKIIRDEKETRLPILQRVRKLDVEIATVDKQLKEQGTKLADAEKNGTKQQQAVALLEKSSAVLLATFPGPFEQRLWTAEESRTALDAELTVLLQQRQLSQILDERNSLEKRRGSWKELDRLKQSIAESLREETELDRRLTDLDKEIQALVVERESLQHLAEEQDNDIERLDEKRRLLDRIRSLEDERNLLLVGKPCPLCGATEHPYAEGNVPNLDETDNLLAKTKKQRKKTAESLTALEIRDTGLKKDVMQLGKEKIARHDAAEKSTRLFADMLEQLGLDAAPTEKVREMELGVLQSRIAGLTQTISDVESLQGQTKELDKELIEARKIQGEIKTERTLLQSLDEQLERTKSDHEIVLRSRDEKIDTRRKIYGDGNPDDEERQRTEAERNADQQFKNAQKDRRETEQHLTKLCGSRETLNQTAERHRKSIETVNHDFDAALKKIFETEEAFLAARLPAVKREELEKKKQSLESKRTELETLVGENVAALEKEIAARPSEGDPPRETAIGKKDELGVALKSIRENIGRLRERLRADETLRNKRKDLSEQRERWAKESLRWKMLYDLIGSSDGKKFRTFAQGLTFKTMIEHANRHLAVMSGRYLLVQDDTMDKPLGLAVVDAYQASVVRSTKNLSGGESFLVSLALALGLSSMASRNIRVDSLFLDEGFGTLDDQALDTAISVLESLRQDGKQIGIISHVAAIKERIVAQIRVLPQRAGRSRIELYRVNE